MWFREERWASDERDVVWKVPCMQASMSRSFFVVVGHIDLLDPLGGIKPVASSAPCVIRDRGFVGG